MGVYGSSVGTAASPSACGNGTKWSAGKASGGCSVTVTDVFDEAGCTTLVTSGGISGDVFLAILFR